MILNICILLVLVTLSFLKTGKYKSQDKTKRRQRPAHSNTRHKTAQRQRPDKARGD